MKLPLRYRQVWTPHGLNFLLFGVGMLGVGFATHWDGLALFCAFVASLHVEVTQP